MLKSDDNIVRFLYDPGVDTYEFDFPFWSKDDIKVYATVNGMDMRLDRSLYEVSEPAAVGSIKLEEPAPAGTSNLTIAREVAIRQSKDYRNGEPIDAENIEGSFDELTAMVQQVSEQIQRTVQLPISENAQTFMMPGTEARKGKVLGFDGTGKNFTIYENPNEAIGSIKANNYEGVAGVPTVVTFTKLNGETVSLTIYNGRDGAKGDKFTYADLTEADKEELRQGLSSVTKTYESSTNLTSSSNQAAINIPEYNSETDSLDVFVNGMRVNSNEYTIVDNAYVIFKYVITQIANISFVVTKHLTLAANDIENILADVDLLAGKLATEIEDSDDKAISAGAIYRYKALSDDKFADIEELMAGKASQASLDETNAEVAKKIDESFLDAALDDKADLSYVSTELGKKADSAYIENNYAKKTEIANVYRYKGSVAEFANLPASNNIPGDVYNVDANGANYAWTGEEWDALGGIMSVENDSYMRKSADSDLDMNNHMITDLARLLSPAEDGKASDTIFVPYYSYSTLGVAAGQHEAFFKAWLKKMAALYPSAKAILVGQATPAYRSFIICYMQSSSVTSEGYPTYASGLFFSYKEGECYHFLFDNGAFKINKVLTILDSSLTSTGTNPVQGKAIYAMINSTKTSLESQIDDLREQVEAGGGGSVEVTVEFATMDEVQALITTANSIYGDSQLNSALDEINGEVV